MAQTEGGSNVAIIAIFVIALLVAGAVFMYFQGGFSGGGTSVVERNTNTVIERDSPKSEAPAAKEEGPGFSLSHENDEGRKTTIEAD